MNLSRLSYLLLAAIQLANVIELCAAVPPPPQITLDGSLGVRDALAPNGKGQFQITADLGQKLEHNLFHSFGQFNLNKGYEAVFSGPADVHNILARVTGGASTIDGKLSSSIQGANLFLLNPSGITFGENAALNVTGAFYASTAAYILLSDGKRFEAGRADAARLSTASPTAFGFSDPGNGRIALSKTDLVNNNGNLGLVGGAIEIQGGGQQRLKKVAAPGNTIVLASMNSAGELAIAPDQIPASAARFNEQGTIRITGAAVIDATPTAAGTGGQVLIRGGKLIVENATIQKDSLDASKGWGVDIETKGDVRLSSGAVVSTEARNADGKASGLSIKGDEVILDSGSRVSSSSSGSGDGGAIQVLANKVLINEASIQTQTSGPGAGGSIYIAGGRDGAPAGIISITSSGSESNVRAVAQSRGNADSITIIASRLELSGPQSTVAGYTSGAGSGANVALFVGKLAIESGARLDLQTYGPGNGGQLFVLGTQPAGEWARLEDLKWKTDPSGFGQMGPERAATAVIIHSGTSNSEDKTGILSGSSTPRVNPGASGEITVVARSIEVAGPNAEVSAKALQNGNAGTVVLASQGDLTVRDGAQVLVSSEAGTGGDARLTAGGSLNVLGKSTVSAEGSPGGNVILGAAGRVYLLHSEITAKTETESGRGGNITIQGLSNRGQAVAPQFVVLDGSQLRANAPVGTGGNISIGPAPFLQSVDSPTPDVTGKQPGIAVLPVENRSPISTLAELRTDLRELNWAQPASWELTDLGGYTVVGSRRESEARQRIILEH